MRKTYRTAIVGTGAIADAHARAVHAVPERARLVAAVDVDVPRAKEFARTWDVPATYASVAELLANEDVDLVHVRTQPRAHLPVALECVAAGATEDVSMAIVRFDYEHATVEGEHLYGYRDTDWTVTPAPGRQDVWLSGVDIPGGHEAQLVAVFDELDRGEPPPVTLADARDTVEFIAALYESAFTGGPVRRGEVSAAFAERMDGTGTPRQQHP